MYGCPVIDIASVVVAERWRRVPPLSQPSSIRREKQLENLYADYWRTEYKIAMGEHKLSSRPIQEEIRTVFSDDSFSPRPRPHEFSDRAPEGTAQAVSQ